MDRVKRARGNAKREIWYVYIVRCADGTFYTGMAKDVDRRSAAHNSGRGAAYTRARRPVRVVYRQKMWSRISAMKREIMIKRLSRAGKEWLILRFGSGH